MGSTTMVPMAVSWPQLSPVWVLICAAAIGSVWLFGPAKVAAKA